MVWWAIASLVVNIALQIVLAPKPQKIKPAHLADFKAPTAEEGRSISILFGTKVMKGPNVVWYGDLKTTKIKGSKAYGLFGPRPTIGYKYSLGMHMVLCHGVADALLGITIGDKVAWTGVSSGGRISINQPSLFGGDKGAGGIVGDIDVEMGAPAQTQNDYLLSVLGDEVSANRGVVGIVLRQVYLGNSPYLNNWAFRLQRIYLKSDGTDQWYKAKAGIGTVTSPLTAGQTVALSWYQSTFEQSVNDQATMGIGFLDSTGTLIGSVTYASLIDTPSDPTNTTGVWTNRTLSASVPSGAAGIRVYMKMHRRTGVNNDGYIDSISATLDGTPLPIGNAGAEDGTATGWTNETGGLGTRSASPLAHEGTYYFTGGDSTDTVAYQQVGQLGTAMNPAHIIRECLTDKTWGMGYNDGDIDDTYFTAAADTLFAENFGLILEWTVEAAIEDFVGTVLNHINGTVYTAIDTGKIRLKLIRDDYDIGTIPSFTEDDVVSWEQIQRRSPAEAVNRLTVTYYDAVNDAPGSVAVINPAQLGMGVKPNADTRDYSGIPNQALAITAATRDLASLGVGLVTGSVTLTRKAASLNPGDPFRLTASRHNLSGEVMRATGLKYGDGRSNGVAADFAQDVFAMPDIGLIDPVTSVWSNPSSAPQAAARRLVVEADYRSLTLLVGATQAGTSLADDPDFGTLLAAAGAPSGDATDALVDIDAGSGYVEADDTLSFCDTALLSSDIGALDTTATVSSAADLGNVTVGLLGAIGDEIVRLDGISGMTLTLGRGCCDTIPEAHSAGEAIIFYEEDIYSDLVARTSADSLAVKLLTVTGQGQLDASVAPADTVTFASRAIRPLRPANVKVEGQATGLVGVTADPIDWTVSRRNRLTDAAAPKAWTEADETPESGQTITIDIYETDGVTLITSITGITGASGSVAWSNYGSNNNAIWDFRSVRDGYTSQAGWRINVKLPRLIATRGIYTLTGYAATLIFGNPSIAAGTGVYTLTGIDADFATTFIGITAETGSYALTGQNAGLLRDRDFPVATGTYTLTGIAATLSQGVTDYYSTFTIPSGKVASDLTNFVSLIDLTDMPSTFWTTVNSDGGDIRVTNSSNTVIPFDLAKFDKTNKLGFIFFKATLLTASDNVFRVHHGNAGLSLLPATDTNGRNAVWSDYHRVLAFDSLKDRTGAGSDAAASGTTAYGATYPFGVVSVSPELTNGHNGVAWDGTYYYVTGTNRIDKYDSSWTLITSNTDPCTATGLTGVNHCGDPDIIGGYLVIPIEKYTNSPYNNQHLCRFNLSTLAFVDSFDISAQAHEASGVGYNPTDGYAYVTNFVSGSTALDYYNPASSYAYVGTLSLSGHTVGSAQGVTFYNGKMYIAHGDGTSKVTVSRFALNGTYEAEAFVLDDTQMVTEGISHNSTGLLVCGLILSAPYMKVYEAKDGANGTASWLFLNGAGWLNFTGLTKLTDWSIGASIIMTHAGGVNHGVMGYSQAASNNSALREGITYRATSNLWGEWNSTDTWLTTGSAPRLASRYRVNATHQNTTQRKLYVDGSGATDSVVAQRPAGTGDGLVIGASDPTGTEPMYGYINYVYLRNGILSDNWIAAEAANWKSPSTFYTVS